MLPPGHIAAGYLTGLALLKFANPALSQSQQTEILYWTMFWSFAPDLDVFWYFFKNKTMLISGETKINHRSYLSHAPILWAIASGLIYFFGSTIYVKFFALALLLGSFSHFVLDSIEYGIMWLWPVSTKVYALKSTGEKFAIEEQNFFKHIWQFLKLYSKRLTFYFEVIIIVSSIIIYFK